MEDVLQSIVDRIVRAANPDKIILFGSRAQGGQAADRDYDILVLKAGEYHRRELAHKTYRELVGIPAPVDVVVASPERAGQYRDVPGFIYGEALKGRVLYEH
ncbi:MAG: nucleotidyltransferase domain-containing protein [Firmicutes bacterium]|jgi:predicted nucleotidyltransferase|nr:nucleotidyltransferase domain-containing protein [Bacillota bacterium]